MVQAHTFLTQPGYWLAEGTFYDPRGQALPITGSATVTHDEAHWLNHSEMTLQASPPVSFRNRYEIEPMEQGLEATIWETEHETLGLLIGTLVQIEDALILSYTAKGGHYSGTETLRQIDADHYQSWGVLWQGDQKISSWQARLTRTQS